MNSFTTIPKFRFWCQKILPLVYDDSLSYMELLCKVVDYLNKVIEDINNIPDYINSMVSDEKLKEILSELLDELREQIARANEGENTTASFNRDVDELLWLNGRLVRMTRAILAGDRYVEDDGTPDVTGNFVYTSVEIELQRVKDSLANEITTRQQADTQLQDNIDTEALARQQADTQLQGNIDAEALARQQADTQLQNNISAEATARGKADTQLQNAIEDVESRLFDVNDLDFINVLEHGLVNDGVTDNATALQTLINNASEHTRLYFPSGTYLINDNIRITKPLHLYGDGFGDVTNNTNGSGRGSTSIIAGSNVSDLFTIGNENNYIFDCSIENMLIDGGTYVNTAIALFSGVMCNFINLHIRQCKVAGIYIACYDNVLCQFNRICNYDYVYGASSVTENSSAIALNGGTTAQVTQNYIENIRALCKNGYCISIAHSDNNVFTKCFGVSEVGTLQLNDDANNNYIDYMGGGKILQSNSYGNKINHLISEGSAVTNLDGKPLWYDVEDYITGENYKSDFYWLSKTIDISAGDFLLMDNAKGYMNGNGVGFIGFSGTGALCFSSKFKNFRHGTLSTLILYVAGSTGTNETLELKASVLTDLGSVAVTDKTETVSINTPVGNAIYRIVVPLDLIIDKDQLFNITLNRSEQTASNMMILGAQINYIDQGPVGTGSGPYTVTTIESINQ